MFFNQNDFFIRNTPTLKMHIGKQYTYMLRAYGFASYDELLKFFKHRPITVA